MTEKLFTKTLSKTETKRNENHQYQSEVSGKSKVHSKTLQYIRPTLEKNIDMFWALFFCHLKVILSQNYHENLNQEPHWVS